MRATVLQTRTHYFSFQISWPASLIVAATAVLTFAGLYWMGFAADHHIEQMDGKLVAPSIVRVENTYPPLIPAQIIHVEICYCGVVKKTVQRIWSKVLVVAESSYACTCVKSDASKHKEHGVQHPCVSPPA